MIWRAEAAIIAALLAIGFTMCGELLLRRRAENLAGWNESFLVGAGVCAAFLFPLSVLLPRKALGAVLVLLAAATLYGLVRRVAGRWGSGSPRSKRPETPRAPMDVISLAAIAVIAGMTIVFAVLNARYTFLWDGFQIWATKAQALHHEGGLRPLIWIEPSYDGRIVRYPNLIPLYEALLMTVRGRFDFEAVKPVFLIFYLSLIVSTHALARSVLSRRGALVAVALLLLLPTVSISYNAGGYADMPMAAYVAASGAAGASAARDPHSRRAAPWLIGSLTTVKSEGTVLLAIFCLSALLVLWRERRGEPPLRRSLPRIARPAAVVLLMLALRLGYVAWTQNPDATYGPIDREHLAAAPGRIPEIARYAFPILFRVRDWALLWPAFFVAAPLVAVKGTLREKALALGAALALCGYAAIFLFTNWKLVEHIPQAYSRLAEHVAPVAVVVAVLGYEIARGRQKEPALREGAA